MPTVSVLRHIAVALTLLLLTPLPLRAVVQENSPVTAVKPPREQLESLLCHNGR